MHTGIWSDTAVVRGIQKIPHSLTEGMDLGGFARHGALRMMRMRESPGLFVFLHAAGLTSRRRSGSWHFPYVEKREAGLDVRARRREMPSCQRVLCVGGCCMRATRASH